MTFWKQLRVFHYDYELRSETLAVVLCPKVLSFHEKKKPSHFCRTVPNGVLGGPQPLGRENQSFGVQIFLTDTIIIVVQPNMYC